MKKVKAATCILAAGLMVFSTAGLNAYAAPSATEIQATLHTQQQQQADLQKQMDDLKKTIQDLQNSIQDNEKKLTDTKNSITETQKQIQDLTIKINQLEEIIQKRQGIIKNRLKSMQEQPTSNMVTDVIVNAKSFADLLDRISNVGLVLQSDKDLMDAQQRDQDQVKAQREEIVKKNAELQAFMADLEKTNNQLSDQRSKKQQTWNDLNDKFQKLINDISSSQTQLSAAQTQALEQSSQFLQRTSADPTPQPTPAAIAQTVASSKSAGSSNNGGVVGKAMQYLGVPYVFGGASPSGFDCSGFISYVYGVGRQDVNGYWGSVAHISGSSLQPGDLVFFQNTYKAGPSHMGIYIGNGQMVHAGDAGIEVSSLSNSYNQSHFLGYGRF
ncbi:NlpC/P60 family protein [Ectobacillus sp. sgz5001026]|uniref:C40 family peptidase n=1 Tax=Ectobacillus sp. sgz5001026 TaxID=3242473 RepID=UPI0036D33F17